MLQFVEPEFCYDIRTLSEADAAAFILEKLEQFRPLVIGLSARVGSHRIMRRLLQRLTGDALYASSVLVVGNVLSTFAAPELAGEWPGVLFCQGDGELTIDGIYKVLKGERTLSDVPNLVFASEAGIVETRRAVMPSH